MPESADERAAPTTARLDQGLDLLDLITDALLIRDLDGRILFWNQEAQRRIYRLRPEPLAEVDAWLGRYRGLWEQRLDALHTEVARGKHRRRSTT